MEKTKIILIAVIILIAASFAHEGSHSRGGHKHQGCTIIGTVLDSISSQPIEYVSISVVETNGEILTGGITDSNGKFKIKGIKSGQYDIKIEYMGFSPQVFRGIELSFREKPVKLLGEIKLEPKALELEAVMKLLKNYHKKVITSLRFQRL